MYIEEMFRNMDFPKFVKLEHLWNPKWLNATFNMKDIEEELLAVKQNIVRNCRMLAALPSYSHEALIFFQKTLDVAGALAKVTELAEVEAKKKQLIEEENQRKAVENRFSSETKEPVLETPTQNEEGKWIAFEACLTSKTALMLKSFFEANCISFRPICKGE
jgi:hypothetical protein